jgi:predicted dehydrogenase
MKRIKIAQIGVGHDHAGQIFNTLRNMPDVFDVVGYAIPDDDVTDNEWELSHLKNQSVMYQGVPKYTVEEILSMPDLDAVTIETYDLLLVKYAKMAVERGINVHVDKAPGESEKEFEELLSMVKEKNLLLNMGYMYRYNPVIKNSIERAKKGEIGKINDVEAEMNIVYGIEKREWLKGFKGGMMQYLGCHLVDLVVRTLGVPEEIIPSNYSTGVDGLDVLDGGFAVFKYKNAMATIKSNMVDVGGFVRRHLTLKGDKGTIQILPLEKVDGKYYEISSISTEYGINDGFHSTGTTNKSEIFDRYGVMLKEFASMVRGDRKAEVDLETEARIHRCLLKANGMDVDYKGEIKL